MRFLAFLLVSFLLGPLFLSAQNQKTIKLSEPNKKRGLPVMEALAVRASATDWATQDLSSQDLSDLLWAANGINRPDSGKKTAPSAMNAQDIDIYVFIKDGIYLYEAKTHSLVEVVAGDHRSLFFQPRPPRPATPGQPGQQPPPPAGGSGLQEQPTMAPVVLLLVSDISRFRAGNDDLKKEWAALDTGIVSQNISIFCAGVGLGTRPRAGMDKDKLRELLKLKNTQYPLLNHPVSYKKQ
ncbi:MAG TPA: SagB/ThcOx family dehydrogenase [Candidatus Saccharicenans sp.]|nr:SagB/ThcOx family dehydrogenase [Candidatus Saccharicenans sp.]HRD02066.1 SagB/ThcOx family dehydrogenase [Candidatus Saccharicenans sp.]